MAHGWAEDHGKGWAFALIGGNVWGQWGQLLDTVDSCFMGY